jgi:hypothetical protein
MPEDPFTSVARSDTIPIYRGMQLDLTAEETFALLKLLTETIEGDKFPLAPRVQVLRGILAKFGPMGPAPPPPARPPTPEERDPSRRPRSRSRRGR